MRGGYFHTKCVGELLSNFDVFSKKSSLRHITVHWAHRPIHLSLALPRSFFSTALWQSAKLAIHIWASMCVKLHVMFMTCDVSTCSVEARAKYLARPSSGVILTLVLRFFLCLYRIAYNWLRAENCNVIAVLRSHWQKSPKTDQRAFLNPLHPDCRKIFCDCFKSLKLCFQVSRHKRELCAKKNQILIILIYKKNHQSNT